jgi:hypothetical protein
VHTTRSLPAFRAARAVAGVSKGSQVCRDDASAFLGLKMLAASPLTASPPAAAAAA